MKATMIQLIVLISLTLAVNAGELKTSGTDSGGGLSYLAIGDGFPLAGCYCLAIDDPKGLPVFGRQEEHSFPLLFYHFEPFNVIVDLF